MKRAPKMCKLVEEQLFQKDNFDEDEELEEDTLVKSTVNDLLEGNVDVTSSDSKGLKSAVFPSEDTFSSKAYAGKKISRKSLNFENDELSGSDSSDYNASSKKKKPKKNNERKYSSENSDVSDDHSSGEDSLKKEQDSDSDDNCGSVDDELDEKDISVKQKKKVRFNTPSQGSENSSSEESNPDDDDENDSNEDESEIEDDLSDDDDLGDQSSFLYSKNFKDEPSEIEKGIAIRNQLNLWEVLLESRIMLQKCLVTANKLPKPQKFEEISSQVSSEEKDIMIECKEKVWDLLEKLILIQNKRRKQNDEFMSNRTEITESASTVDEDNDISLKVKRRKLNEYPEILEKQYNEFIPYRNTVIQKWNDRTKIASGKLAKSNFSAFDQPVLKQIEQIMSDKNRLIQKTFVKRSHYSIIGEEPAEDQETTDPKNAGLEINREIFDDDDFYHKLLRDYIERKTSNINDPTQLGKKWIQLQNLRKKTKRKIDTRRTKGRKIKFDVHPKLVNFMAPVVVDVWEDNAVNELFSSIFGKNLINQHK